MGKGTWEFPDLKFKTKQQSADSNVLLLIYKQGPSHSLAEIQGLEALQISNMTEKHMCVLATYCTPHFLDRALKNIPS